MNFTKQQKEKIQELLKDQLSGDFAQIAYNIYLEHKGLNKNK